MPLAGSNELDPTGPNPLPHYSEAEALAPVPAAGEVVAPALAVEAEVVGGEAAAQVPAEVAQALVREPVVEQVRVRVLEPVQVQVPERGAEVVAVAEAHRHCRQYELFERSASGDSRRSALDLSAPADRSPACGRYRSKVPGLAADRSPLPLREATWREAISD